MKPLIAPEVFGNWATLMLPINRDDSIDYGLLAAELDYFVSARVNGIYSNGSAGEFYTQDEGEFDRISELLATRCNAAGMPFQIGASHTSPQMTRARIRRAKPLQPGAFQVILPDWFPPTFDEIVAFFEVIAAEAMPIPLIAYNPPHAKRHLTPAEWTELIARVPAIIGMKVPGGDEHWYAAMGPLMKKVSVFIPGHTLATGLARGAHGAYSNVACLHPRGAQLWYELCQRDPMAGRQLESKIQAFWLSQIAPLITERKFPNMAADKAAAAAGGWLPGFNPRLRWPYRALPEGEVAALGAAAHRMVPELLSF